MKEIVVGIIGLIGVYLFYKMIFSQQQKPRPGKDHYGDILNKEEYRVKGQWEK